MHAIIIFKGVKLFSKQLLSLGIDFVSKLKLLYVAYIVNGDVLFVGILYIWR